MCINELNLFDRASIVDIMCDEKLGKRLRALGLVVGTDVTLKQIAPFGDPIVVEFKNVNYCIRKRDAKGIIVELKR